MVPVEVVRREAHGFGAGIVVVGEHPSRLFDGHVVDALLLQNAPRGLSARKLCGRSHLAVLFEGAADPHLGPSDQDHWQNEKRVKKERKHLLISSICEGLLLGRERDF